MYQSFFNQEIDHHEAEKLFQYLIVRDCKKNEILYEEKKPADSIFFIRKGQIELTFI